MQKKSLSLLGLLLFIFFISACNRTGIEENSPVFNMIGHDVYLKVNVWYENPKKMPSTNYHKGIMLHAGDKFKIVAVSGRKVVFSDKNGTEYALLYNRKHTLVNVNDFVDRTFGKQSVTRPGGAFSKFTKMEQKNIRKGKIVTGMSKNAVIMAYGYPPEHRTPSLKGNIWRYWNNRFISKIVTFDNGKVTAFQ